MNTTTFLRRSLIRTKLVAAAVLFGVISLFAFGAYTANAAQPTGGGYQHGGGYRHDGYFGGGLSGLGELIILDRLFQDGYGYDRGDRRTSRLGELIILDSLFGGRGHSGGVGSGRISPLGELIILDSLFR